ncbi:MAG: beta-hydroxyacyl-ACP dehydratase, partial [Gammaproteobacteria bacterium]
LVTTPAHLRTLVQSGLIWPPVALTISATAPLVVELANQVERAMHTEVHEIFGFSEAGSVASRRTTGSEWWRPYAGLELVEVGSEVRVQGGHVPQPVVMNDRVEIASDGRFRLLGRKSDIVNVAGKRASLTELNAKLTRIDGVEDGVFVVPEPAASAPAANELARLGALVVAPELTKLDVLRALAEALDPVFMPRPLRKVPALARNGTGKLPRAALLERFEQRDEDEPAAGERPASQVEPDSETPT